MRAALQVIEGTDAHGRELVPIGARLRVGRHPSNGLVLAHEGASRYHAMIESSGGDLSVRDLGSKNGTTVDGQPVEGVRMLCPGEILRFGGGAAWRLVLDEAPVQREPPPTHSSEGGPARLCLQQEGGARQVWADRLLTIGRDPSNTLVLDHERVSGHHALIELRGPGWFLRDLGSRNGTTVDGRRVMGWRALAEGCQVHVGGCSRWIVRWAGGGGDRPLRRHTEADPTPPDLLLTLFWDGEDGRIRVEQGGATWEEPAGQTFLLLWELAAAPAEWVDDATLKAALWGAAAGRRARTALNTAVYNARRLLAGHGLPPGIVEKDPSRRGRTRLNLPPDRVRRGPTGSPDPTPGP